MTERRTSGCRDIQRHGRSGAETATTVGVSDHVEVLSQVRWCGAVKAPIRQKHIAGTGFSAEI
jgi:hypothetical protein